MYDRKNSKKTAIKRKDLSVPYKTILHKLKGKTILDIGCGHGFDVLYLSKNGYNIFGYDPFWEKWQNEKVLKKHDVITSNYVINIIEDKEELKEHITLCYSLAKEIVFFSARFDKNNIKESWENGKNDGYITGRNTYQKFYSKKTLKDLIETELEVKGYYIKDTFVVERNECS